MYLYIFRRCWRCNSTATVGMAVTAVAITSCDDCMTTTSRQSGCFLEGDWVASELYKIPNVICFPFVICAQLTISRRVESKWNCARAYYGSRRQRFARFMQVCERVSDAFTDVGYTFTFNGIAACCMLLPLYWCVRLSPSPFRFSFSFSCHTQTHIHTCARTSLCVTVRFNIFFVFTKGFTASYFYIHDQR